MKRTALITGGVGGIGAATARLLKSSGYTVVASYSGNDDAESLHRDTGIPIRAWNVADFDATQANIAAITKEFGPVDILANNAGITCDSTLHKMTPEQWRSVLDVDLGGCYNTCRTVIESMRERRFGQTNYAAAKAGIIGFTKALALEGASHGITVNAIAPGYTDTSMVHAVPTNMLDTIVAAVPVRRLAKPEEIARGVLFLVGEDAGFITGTTLSINGGKYMA